MVISWTMRACFLSKQSFWCWYQRQQSYPCCKYEEERYGPIYRLKSPVMLVSWTNKNLVGTAWKNLIFQASLGYPLRTITALLPVCQKHHSPAWATVAARRSQYSLLKSDPGSFHSCRGGAVSSPCCFLGWCLVINLLRFGPWARDSQGLSGSRDSNQ